MKIVTTTRTAKTASTSKQPVVKGPSQTEPQVRVLKTGQAPSLSGNSQLSYEVGLEGGKELRLRITANTKAGGFCQEWVDVMAALAALEKVPKGETVSSDQLSSLFRRRSSNMPGFVFSILLHEGLLRRSEKERRRYERVEPQERDAGLKGLLEGKAAPDGKVKKTKGPKVTEAGKPSGSTKNKKSPS